jgi:tRNA threonylcarbamoyl adenosine modification protein YeaZ
LPSEAAATILGLDTSAAQCAAALVSGGRVIAWRVEPMEKGQAERLFPMVEEMLAGAGADWAKLAAVGVCTGPGNFTGLRLSVAAARGIALARGIPAIGVSLFEALADGGTALVTLDARGGLLFVQAVRDGRAEGAARVLGIDELTPAPGMTCLGHRAAEVAGRVGGVAGSEAVRADPAAVARLAGARMGTPGPRPAPLYLRPADAAPPSEAPPPILGDA